MPTIKLYDLFLLPCYRLFVYFACIFGNVLFSFIRSLPHSPFLCLSSFVSFTVCFGCSSQIDRFDCFRWKMSWVEFFFSFATSLMKHDLFLEKMVWRIGSANRNSMRLLKRESINYSFKCYSNAFIYIDDIIRFCACVRAYVGLSHS